MHFVGTKLPWRPQDPCPCESGSLLRDCCLLKTGELRKEVPSLQPQGPSSGLRQSRCYLASTEDCSSKLTGEHYMSRTVLDAFPGTPAVAINGMPWLAPGERRIVGINSLTANILCDRHNSSLSPLDTEAGRIFRMLQAIDVDLTNRSLSRKNKFYLVSGELFELWMLKAACGIIFSRICGK
jgi:hypothetical protein